MPLHQVFDYKSNTKLSIGARVWVKFGRGNRKLIGIVIAQIAQSKYPESKLKQVESVIDDYDFLNSEILELCKWVAKYYQAPLGETLHLAIPKVLRKKSTIRTSPIYYWQAHGEIDSIKQQLKSSSRQIALWIFIKQHPQVASSTINQYFKTWPKVAEALIKKNLLEKFTTPQNLQIQKKLKLNTEQKLAVDSLPSNKFFVMLLFGITASGKTEVFLQIIDKIINKQQVLVLVPEISLTPQILQRFKSRFNCNIQIQHSKLSDGERYLSWQACKNGTAKILIGTRSSVFNQFDNLGLIIIDEEHDSSFKQQNGVNYSARDIAVVRAKKLNIPIILASATPSLESLHNANKGIYNLFTLKQKAEECEKIKLKIIDTRDKHENFAPTTLKEIKLALKNNNQVMVFINRRGYSPTMYCNSCGHIETCSYCDVNLTIHKNPLHLLCHQCGTSKPVHNVCPKCNQQQLLMLGVGSEKVEQQLKKIFPQYPVLRIDRDTTTKKNSWQELYSKINTGQACILVGTQMLAKGHHFPNLSLLVMLGVDQGYLSADFKASEHVSQLLIQVVGRVGRTKTQGQAILQTQNPNNPLIKIALEGDYSKLSQNLLLERQESNLPPFTSMAVIRAKAPTHIQAKDFLDAIKKTITFANIEVFGPIRAPIEKINNQYRYQLIIQAKSKNILQVFLKNWLTEIRKTKTKVDWSIDIDPLNLS